MQLQTFEYLVNDIKDFCLTKVRLPPHAQFVREISQSPIAESSHLEKMWPARKA